LVGSTLAHYRITAPLGAGGMGEVYRATDTKLGREVAVKVLPADVAGDADRLARLEREARAVAALSHPNILSVYELGRDDGTAYLVTRPSRCAGTWPTRGRTSSPSVASCTRC
jgi:serine/threonine protein kinase